jgi:hypothetical protein
LFSRRREVLACQRFIKKSRKRLKRRLKLCPGSEGFFLLQGFDELIQIFLKRRWLRTEERESRKVDGWYRSWILADLTTSGRSGIVPHDDIRRSGSWLQHRSFGLPLLGFFFL